jgi:RNA polymerase sigma-70 factor (ECF subfamily)
MLQNILPAKALAAGFNFNTQLLTHYPALQRYALSLTKNRARADDLVQETALKALEVRAVFTPGTNLEGWLFEIMKKRHLSSISKASRENKRLAEGGDEFWEVITNQGFYTLVPDETIDLKDSLLKLEDSRLEFFFDNHALGLEIPELAEKYGISVAAAKSRARWIRKELRDNLGEAYPD